MLRALGARGKGATLNRLVQDGPPWKGTLRKEPTKSRHLSTWISSGEVPKLRESGAKALGKECPCDEGAERRLVWLEPRELGGDTREGSGTCEGLRSSGR